MNHQGSVLNSTGYQVDIEDITRAKGMVLKARSGKTYLDFESGVWCLPLGHSCRAINQAIHQQQLKIAHTGYRYTLNLIEQSAQVLLRISGFEKGKCVFLSSGSEAVEYSMQLVNHSNLNKKGLRLKNYYLSAYGHASIYQQDWIEIDVDNPKLETINFNEIGYFLFEPGNYSGMVKLPDRNLVNQIVEQIKLNDGLVIVDEVTTGIGRCGQWFGFQNYGIVPDIIACGKGLGNGYPISAVICSTRHHKMKHIDQFRYAQSHQNDPMGARVLMSVIKHIEKKELLTRAHLIGDYLHAQLNQLQNQFRIVKDVRGVGLMQAITLTEDISIESMKRIQNQLFEFGLIVATVPPRKVIRFYPPLIITKKQINRLIHDLKIIFNEMTVAS